MATSQNPNPSRNEPQMQQRNWAELNRDVLILIFQMVGTIDVLKSGEFVCRAWRKVARDEPEVWRRIDVTNHGYRQKSLSLKDPTKLAVDRSKGRLEQFWIESFCEADLLQYLFGRARVEELCDDDLLQYLCDRTSVLKSLRLISCNRVSDKGVVETAKRQPLLEELELTCGSSWTDELPALVGKELPNLRRFKLHGFYNWSYLSQEIGDDVVAFGIAKTMHQLRSLELVCNGMTNEGLKAILEGCPHLEMLDIRSCCLVKMNSDMRARCARLMTLRLPSDLIEDFLSEWEETI